MNTNSASKKVISMVCLIAGIILLAVALIQDISGSGAGWRGPALIIGAIGILLGMYLFPTLKHHRSIVIIFDKSLRCSLRRYDICIILDDIASVFARLSVLLSNYLPYI